MIFNLWNNFCKKMVPMRQTVFTWQGILFCLSFCMKASLKNIAQFGLQKLISVLQMTVTSSRYLTVMKKFAARLRRRNVDFESQWFQQDGAPAHTATASRRWIRDKFGGNVISLKEAFEWSPHSPDLNPCDFFLWGHLKDCIYRNKPTTLQQLKENVLQYSRDIDQHLCERVIQSFKKRMKVCVQRKGRHLEHVIWILSMSTIFFSGIW